MPNRLSQARLLNRFSYFFMAAAVLILTLGLPDCQKQPSGFNELTRLAESTETDKGLRGHYYTELYDVFFLPLKNGAAKILEIGIAGGDSLKMWMDYFPRATIYGIDIVPKTKLDSARIKTFVADQADRTQLESFIGKFGGDFDIIIDDGGHLMNQQQISLGFLFKYVKPGGYYIIEDLHTSLQLADGSNSSLDMIFKFIRDMRLESLHMLRPEERYLTHSIEFVNLFMRKRADVRYPSIMCILKKRTRSLDTTQSPGLGQKVKKGQG